MGAPLRSEQPTRQLDLFERQPARRQSSRRAMVLCGVCREQEARYGFRDDDLLDRPGTLCFECFRLEITRRQDAAARTTRPSSAAAPPNRQVSLAEKIDEASHRRHRAQIAARHALEQSSEL